MSWHFASYHKDVVIITLNSANRSVLETTSYFTILSPKHWAIPVHWLDDGPTKSMRYLANLRVVIQYNSGLQTKIHNSLIVELKQWLQLLHLLPHSIKVILYRFVLPVALAEANTIHLSGLRTFPRVMPIFSWARLLLLLNETLTGKDGLRNESGITGKTIFVREILWNLNVGRCLVYVLWDYKTPPKSRSSPLLFSPHIFLTLTITLV